MRNVYNFSAGPAVLPEEVLQEAADEMLNYKNSGMSVMEISHRSALFQSIIDETKDDLKRLMNIPDDYEVLFLQGGTSLQFAMIPMNFMRNRKADYIVTGYWAKEAYKEAKLFGDINIAASSENRDFSYIPDSVILIFHLILTICICVRTIRFTEQNSIVNQIVKVKF